MAQVLGTTDREGRSSSGASLVRRSLLPVSMLALQLLWLGAIAWTGASSDQSLILFLALYSLLAGGVVFLLPDSLIATFIPIQRVLSLGTKRILIGLFLVSTLLGVLYAFNQVPWADEGRSLRVATIVSSEGLVEAYTESGWLRNGHPPLMPLVFGGVVSIFGEDLLYLRLVSVLFLAGTVAVVYLLGRRLYDVETGLLAAVFFLLFPLTVRLGSSGMMDIEVTFFFAVSLLLCLRVADTRSFKQAMLVGALVGIGLMTKYIMVLIFGVVVASMLLIRPLRLARYQLALALLLAAFVGGMWFVYAGHLGILSGQVEKILNYSGIYHLVGGGEATVSPLVGDDGVSEPRANPGLGPILRLGLETLFTRLPSGLGLYLLPLMAAGALQFLKRRTRSDVFVLTWIGVVVVGLFLTLPDHRYFLTAFPAIAILIGNFVRSLPRSGERVLLLAALLAAGNLYLFVDWVREGHLFLS